MGYLQSQWNQKGKKQEIMKKRKADFEEKEAPFSVFQRNKRGYGRQGQMAVVTERGIEERDRRVNTSSTGTGI